MRNKHFISALLATALILPVSAMAQAGPAVQVQPTKTPPTLPVLYRAFLAYQLHLENRADELKAQGKNGEDLRTHYHKVLGFSNEEFAKLHASAVHLDQVLRAKDAEIHDVIVTARAAQPKGPLAPGTVIPGPPDNLKSLFADRQTLINTEIDT